MMSPVRKVIFSLIALNTLLITIFYGFAIHENRSVAEIRLETTQELISKERAAKTASIRTKNPESFSRETLRRLHQNYTDPKSPWKAFFGKNNPYTKFTRLSNPFNLLGAYPDTKVGLLEGDSTSKDYFDQFKPRTVNETDYCERVDYYNLANPDNIFQLKNFFTDFRINSVPRQLVMPWLGKIVKYEQSNTSKNKYQLDITINSFFVNTSDFQKYYEIGRNFLCATQMYNHIPGALALIRKDDLIENLELYAKKFRSKPQCFNKNTFLSLHFRLYKQDECDSFFAEINSKFDLGSVEDDPTQYIITDMRSQSSTTGFTLNKARIDLLNDQYNFGYNCGKINNQFIVQKSISNPIFLEMNKKFSLKAYMLIASTNPLIAYYHDGYFEKPHKLAESNEIWSFENLQEYLLEIGKIVDSNWLEIYLRPELRKKMIHILKMSSGSFLNQSNVYELFELEFVLDNKLNLLFIEANPHPQFSLPNRNLNRTLINMLKSLFEIEYGLYRSRMKRVFGVVYRMRKERNEGPVNLFRWKELYEKAVKNKFEPEYEVTKTNSFTLIMNENLLKSEAYFGNIDLGCI